VEFESLGMDRRLPVELESGLFRILDEALAGYLAARPERVSLRIDWGDELTAELLAGRTPVDLPAPDLPAAGGSLPPALAAMVEDRRAGHAAAVEAARYAAVVQLPAHVWRDLSARAASLGITAELLDEGERLRLIAPLPAREHSEPAPGTDNPATA
jgi:crotonobetainyl-CoA:carnitine CoA-transferase CaiB-like acyl-CoA transferase